MGPQQDVGNGETPTEHVHVTMSHSLSFGLQILYSLRSAAHVLYVRCAEVLMNTEFSPQNPLNDSMVNNNERIILCAH